MGDQVIAFMEEFLPASGAGGVLNRLPLLSLGHGPAQGDAEASIVVAALSRLTEKRGWDRSRIGLAWLHEIPYHPRHPHLARLFQESISSAANVRYETNRGRALEMCRELAAGSDSTARRLLMLVAQDGRKQEISSLLEAVRLPLLQGQLLLLASTGTAHWIADYVHWAWRMDSEPHVLEFTDPIVQVLKDALGAAVDRPRLLTVGSGESGSGDVSFGFVPAALEKLCGDDALRSRIYAAVMWLHDVPYGPRTAHHLTFVQERLTDASIEYGTSVARAKEIASKAERWLRDSNKEVVLGLSAHARKKPELVSLVRRLVQSAKGRLVFVATAGTAKGMRTQFRARLDVDSAERRSSPARRV